MELRNLPQDRLMSYLTLAGGELTGPRDVKGDGWVARLEEMPPAQIGSLRVPRDLLVIEGSDVEVRRVKEFMRQRTMRGGG